MTLQFALARDRGIAIDCFHQGTWQGVRVQTTRLRGAARRYGLVIGLSITLLPVPAYAVDPLTMFLLGFARNLITSAIESHQKSQPPARVVAPAPAPKAPTALDESDLRALVDQSFAHLTSAQRNELLASLDKTLSDPANASQRNVILSQFVNVARQFQFNHTQLNRLSTEEKRSLAEQFATNFRSLPPAQQQEVQEQLAQRALPLPADLNDMMLAALSPTR